MDRQWDVTFSAQSCTGLKLADKSNPLFPSRDEELPEKASPGCFGAEIMMQENVR
jgi:hypothetical protein